MRRLRVAYDSRAATEKRGIGRYASCLLAALREVDLGEVLESHRPRRVDVYHTPWIDGALLRCPCPMVVTLHDLVPLKRRGEYLRTGMRFRLRYLAVQRAVRIIVPTASVAGDAEELMRIDPKQIAIVPEAAAEILHPRCAAEVAQARQRYALPERYLLWVGGLEHPDPRKRVVALARAPRQLPLVMVGPTARWAHELDGDVLLTGEVPDDDLAAIYTGAHALISASDDEGFGLPPVEALACGTPVVACDVPAVREVLGECATLVPADDIDALLAAGEAARRPAPPPPQWTWQDAARRTWEIYADAAERRGPAVPRA
jgi:glycosyltransferase involved in cell wall biosynthesis